MSSTARRAIGWTERGLVPDAVIRTGIRQLLKARLEEIRASDVEGATEETGRFLREMDNAPIAPVPHPANEQHYEVPAPFFGLVAFREGQEWFVSHYLSEKPGDTRAEGLAR